MQPSSSLPSHKEQQLQEQQHHKQHEIVMQQQQQQWIFPQSQYLPRSLSRSFDIILSSSSSSPSLLAGSSSSSTASTTTTRTNIPTDVWIQLFQDTVLVGITQLDQKVGTWLWCQLEPVGDDFSATTKRNFQYSLVLGGRGGSSSSSDKGPPIDLEAVWGLYGRLILEQILEISSSSNNSPFFAPSPPSRLLLGISLQPTLATSHQPEVMHAIVAIVKQVYQDLVCVQDG